MCVYLKNNPAKFHPDPIGKDGAFVGFLKTSPEQEQQQQNE